jgi:glycine cleavage system T protein
MSEHTPLHPAASRAGATFAEDAGWEVPSHYGDALREYWQVCRHVGVFDVSHRGTVELTGADAGRFLQNLCTNDVTRLAVGGGCEAFLTTAKAKVVGHVLIDHVSLPDNRDAWWLDVAPGFADKVLKHLDHYLISEQVEIADRTREFAQIHLAGPEATRILGKALEADVPELAELQHFRGTFGTAGAGHIRRHDPLGVLGYDILCPRSQADGIWQLLLQAGASPAGMAAYEVLRVEAGTPVFGVDIDEDRFVVEVGRGRAICYTKGCYLGQEPIVMARDRGHLNRFLRGLKLSGSEAVVRGAKVLREGNEVGQVTSSVASPRLGTAIALAYVRRGSQEPGTAVEVDTPAGRRAAEVTALPFIGPVEKP